MGGMQDEILKEMERTKEESNAWIFASGVPVNKGVAENTEEGEKKQILGRIGTQALGECDPGLVISPHLCHKIFTKYESNFQDLIETTVSVAPSGVSDKNDGTLESM